MCVCVGGGGERAGGGGGTETKTVRYNTKQQPST